MAGRESVRRGLVPALLAVVGLVPALAFAEGTGGALDGAGAAAGEQGLSPLCPAASPAVEDAIDPLDPMEAKQAAPAPAIAPSVRTFDRPAWTAVDPSLKRERDSGQLLITGSLVTGTLGSAPAGGFEIDDVLCMTPTQTTTAETQATLVNGDSALYANSAPDTDTIVRPTASGVALVESRRGAQTPASFGWKLGVPPGDRLRTLSDGGVAVEDPSRVAPPSHAKPPDADNINRIDAIPDTSAQLAESRYEIARAERETGHRVEAVVGPPYAVDSDGESVRAALTPSGADALTVVVPRRADVVMLRLTAKRPRHRKPKAPTPVNAYPLVAASGDLTTEASNAACSFARSQPRGKRRRLMLLGFGRTFRHAGVFGTGRKPFHPNAEILTALRAAAASYRQHGCHRRRRRATIGYGLNNYKLSLTGDDGKPMSAQVAQDAGAAQFRVARRLRNAENARDDAAVAGDIEPGWDPSYAGVRVGTALVRGADTHRLLYYNFGTAGHCPPFTGPNPGCGYWTFRVLGDISQRHMAVPLPEIYHAYQTEQWATVRKRWNNRPGRCSRKRRHGCYHFAGATSEPKACGSDFYPARSWTMLRNANPPGSVGRELVYWNPDQLFC